jgi:hypothetical protein
VTRRTYDFLIASGDIDTLRDDLLTAKMAAFFALFDGRGDYMNVELRNYSSMTFTPYVNEHLDHVALAQKMHPNDTSMLTPTLPMGQFRNVLGNGEFEGVITTKWHLSLDYRRNNQAMLRHVEEVEEKLTENLARFATESSSD